MILVGILLSVICLAYFYLLDNWIFASRGFSPIFQLLVAVYDANTAWLCAAVSLLAAFWTRPAPILKLVDFLGRHPAAAAVLSIILLSLGTIFIYHDYPLCMDEYAPTFQSKVFASGQLAAHFPAQLIDRLIVPGFNGVFMIASAHTGQVIEAYWPGFAVLLAPFQKFGIPWLCNPILAGIGLFFIYRITFEVTRDRRAGGFALLFALASGAFVANAISFYSMQAHLTANLVFAWLLMSPTRRRALAAGLVGSVALVLHNPLPHALFAFPWLVAMVREKSERKFVAPLILGYLPISIIAGIGWPLLRMKIGADIPHAALTDSALSAVFRWPDAVMLNMRAAALAKMWVWAVPCLFLFACVGRMRHADNRHVRLLTHSAVLTFLGYLFVNLDQGHGWGYRYFHSAWGVVPILAGCAMAGRSESEDRLPAFAGAAAILSLLIIMPYQMWQIDGFITRHLAQLPPALRPGNDVYLIRPGAGFYMGDMIQSDPNLRSRDLLLVSRGAKADAAFVRRYWPGAVRVSGGYWGEQWYLGAGDRRVPAADGAAWKHFDFAGAPLTRSR
ncbi:MAG TPA: hypothetical protein VMV79_08690 [Alphaproteobacteria bacterium]|nr:hypothetical protein [Alphaproteobacteria bacterium]